MLCPKCGKNNRDVATFCAYCGSMLPVEKSIQDSSSTTDIGLGDEQKQTQSAPAQKKSGIGMLIVAIILIISGICNIYDMNHSDLYTVFFDVIPAQYITIPGGLLLLYLYFTEKK